MSTEAADKRSTILSVTVIFFLIACLAVSLRCYVRIKLLRAFGPDDVLTLCSLFLLLSGVVLILMGLGRGFGQHIGDLSVEHYVVGVKYWCLAQISYPPTVFIIKSSIALYLVRIAIKPIHVYTIYISMVLFFVYNVVFFVFLIAQCRPVSFFWRQFEGATDGHCIPGKTIAAIAYGHAALSILTDIILGIIPALVVSDLQISTRTKAAVAMTLALGSISASICTLTRMTYIADLLTGYDYLYAISNVIILTIVESAVGITACCLATLKPLIRSFLDWSERSMNSTGAFHTRVKDRMGTGRTKVDDAELQLRPDLKIIGVTTTIITSIGRDSPPGFRHSGFGPIPEDGNEPSYSPYGSVNSRQRVGSCGGVIQAEPACHIK
ncbi:hypothetical protein DSL72_006219 [Monilinia vaccinii-corymbosi]|uniref:Rhodopsin domain-containing protein n=1 Tax=Monilinia vaccinii-corymbosi TaxID=61207 RepID=A0A8A3PMW1_9HELO|nr:hypothetical protein DSL72_006219 [Monilinia vaccinii-corymbosi]